MVEPLVLEEEQNTDFRVSDELHQYNQSNTFILTLILRNVTIHVEFKIV